MTLTDNPNFLSSMKVTFLESLYVHGIYVRRSFHCKVFFITCEFLVEKKKLKSHKSNLSYNTCT